MVNRDPLVLGTLRFDDNTSMDTMAQSVGAELLKAIATMRAHFAGWESSQ